MVTRLVKCDSCGKSFYRTRARPAYFKRYKHIYCSKKCLMCAMKKASPSAATPGGEARSNGRIFVYKPNHPDADANGRVRRAHLVMEDSLGYLVPTGMVVHHEDERRDNDDIYNLWLMPDRGHRKLHIKHRRGIDGKFQQIAAC